MAKHDDKKITMVAELLVTAPEAGVEEKVRSFDRAWHMALELPVPVNVRFLGFVRAD